MTKEEQLRLEYEVLERLHQEWQARVEQLREAEKKLPGSSKGRVDHARRSTEGLLDYIELAHARLGVRAVEEQIRAHEASIETIKRRGNDG